MLGFPENGFQPSYVKQEVLCDWIEGSVTLVEQHVSQMDVVDMLHENSVYLNKDAAIVEVKDAWTELRRREECMGPGSPFKVRKRRIERAHEWRDTLAYSFCLLVSLQAWYKSWAKGFGPNYTVQGDLFERLTQESLESLGWRTLRTGWTPGNPAGIRGVVRAVAEHVRESEIPEAIDTWIAEHANDEGLDLVCSDEFPDERGGRPLYFFQCASGANWEEKLHTPDPELWRKIFRFTTVPSRGVAIPFALLSNDFVRRSGRINGMMLDRYRLVAPLFYGENGWISRKLSQEILRWLRPRIRKLPLAT